jgi:excisionase family DNA binding protein
MDELLDIATVAAYLGVTERTVYNKVRAGELPASKVGRLWRVRRSDLDAWLDRGRSAAGSRPSAGVPGPYPYPRVDVPTGAEGRPAPTRSDLEQRLEGADDSLTRRMAFVATLSDAVSVLGWPPPVVVGGHAVEFYTAGDYPTQDIDLVGASEPIGEVLDAWGFARQGRHWYDAPLGIVVEAPGSRLTAAQREHIVAVDVGDSVAYVLGVEDLIVDRLNACVHWSDEESCRWARVLLRTAADLDEAYLDRRVAEEGIADAFVRIGGER